MELVESEMLPELSENEQPAIVIDRLKSAEQNSACFKQLEYKRIVFPIKLNNQ